jgi:uncharacterized protein YecE (DUF72 family)
MLSPLIRFGTSTYTYEGCRGRSIRSHTPSVFARECLGEYCQYQYHNEPLFRTVGNDSTFYRPSMANQLLRYLTQIPEDFEMCCKAWEEITIPCFARHVRYGVKAGSGQSALITHPVSHAMGSLFRPAASMRIRGSVYRSQCRAGAMRGCSIQSW